MRQPARSNRSRGRVAITRSTPAAVLGWNARDSIASMKPAEASILTNWFPTASDIMLRKGSAEHATAIDIASVLQEVETLAAYRPGSGLQSLWGWAGTALFNVSSAGAIGAGTVTGLTNARWQTGNFTTTGGTFLLTVNGADEMRSYDGTNWVTINGGSTPSITNVNTDDLIHLNVFKERVFYIERNTLDCWYSAVGAFAGALTRFSLGSIFKKGGFLMAMGNWTIDGGSGIDDLAVFVTSEGEVAVYQGTNPAAAATWALVGIYEIGTPIGRRCLQKLGGDLLIITTDGVVPASRALIKARSDQTVAITDQIQGAMADAVALYASTFGWQLQLYPAGNMLLLNVPVASGSQKQYVMNTVTRRWAPFTGWPANCFEVFNGELYFGTLGEVRKAWTGNSDLGEMITAEVLMAFNYFGNRNSQKHFLMVRPIISWDSNPAEIRIGVDVDFDNTPPSSEITLPESTGAEWDDGLWDVGVWGGDAALNKEWYSVVGVGFAGALHMTVTSSAANVRLSSIDYLFNLGAVL